MKPKGKKVKGSLFVDEDEEYMSKKKEYRGSQPKEPKLGLKLKASEMEEGYSKMPQVKGQKKKMKPVSGQKKIYV